MTGQLQKGVPVGVRPLLDRRRSCRNRPKDAGAREGRKALEEGVESQVLVWVDGAWLKPKVLLQVGRQIEERWGLKKRRALRHAHPTGYRRTHLPRDSGVGRWRNPATATRGAGSRSRHILLLRRREGAPLRRANGRRRQDRRRLL